MQKIYYTGRIISMYYLFLIFFLVLGLIVGSFLNVVVLRYNTGVFARKRSECMSCGHILNSIDLFPVLSFLYLRGKCRYCHSSISIQYPLVELVTAITFLFVYIKVEIIGLELIYSLLFWAIFIAIFVYDFRHKIIPNALVYTLITFSLIRVIWTIYPDFIGNIWLILAGPIAASPFAFLWLVSGGRWMGFGDAKLALTMGWTLGMVGVVSAIIFAFWIGAVVGLLLIALSKIDLSLWSHRFKNLTIKSEIPFAPFLIIGSAIVFFLEITILDLPIF